MKEEQQRLLRLYKGDFRRKGMAQLMMDCDFLPKFEKMRNQFENKGRPRTTIGLLSFFPLKACVLGDPSIVPFLFYLSKVEQLERIDSWEAGEGMIGLEFVRAYGRKKGGLLFS